MVRASSVEVRGHERDWFALAVQASDPDMIEGAHAQSLAVLCDEARAIPADVVAALHGSETDVGVIGCTCCPRSQAGRQGHSTTPSGVAGDLWKLFHTSAEDSSLVSRAWFEERGRNGVLAHRSTSPVS